MQSLRGTTKGDHDVGIDGKWPILGRLYENDCAAAQGDYLQ
jgi:hypothetical protein